MTDLIERLRHLETLLPSQTCGEAAVELETAYAQIDTLKRKLAVKDEALREILGATDVRIHAIARAALEVSDTQGGCGVRAAHDQQ